MVVGMMIPMPISKNRGTSFMDMVAKLKFIRKEIVMFTRFAERVNMII